jgi:mxaD protein
MKRLQAIACVVFAFAAGASCAAAPLLSARESVTIHASPDAVWSRIKDFDGMGNWHPAVASDQIILGSNNTVGAERLLTLHDGGTVRDKLTVFDAKHRRYSYAILKGTLPVSEYTATVTVKAAGLNRSRVTWSATFKRKHTGANPPANSDDAAATRTMSQIHRSGLDHMKKLVESADEPAQRSMLNGRTSGPAAPAERMNAIAWSTLQSVATRRSIGTISR